MKHHFKAKIYKTGINWAVDVPPAITQKMVAEKGYIRIMGQINNFDFAQTLVPVKNAPYRLFVNGIMMKGGQTALGEVATFAIEQDTHKVTLNYPMHPTLAAALKTNKLTDDFEKLTPSRKKEILRYLSMLKAEDIISKHVTNVIRQLLTHEKNVRIP